MGDHRGIQASGWRGYVCEQCLELGNRLSVDFLCFADAMGTFYYSAIVCWPGNADISGSGIG